MSRSSASAVSSSAGHGPLAPWRFPAAVGAALTLTGAPLIRAAMSGDGIDMALGRSLAAAALVWFVLGSINRILLTAETERITAARLAAHADALAAATAAQASDQREGPAPDTAAP